MEVSKEIYEFGQSLLDNFDKKRAKAILNKKNQELDKQIENEEESLLKPTDQDKLKDKYEKWDKIDQTLKKREQFEAKVEKDKQELDKEFMEKMMGCDQNHSKEIDIYNRPFKEKMEIVQDFKDKGNQYFHEENYEKASYFYAKALLQFYYIIPEDDKEDAIVKPIQVSCHLNQALCYYKQKRYDEGLTEWYQALNLEPNNVKGLYRQAQLNMKKQNFNKVEEDIKKGLDLEPDNKAFLELKKELIKEKKEYISTSKKVYAKMMQGEEQKGVDEQPQQQKEEKVVELDESYTNEEIDETQKVEEIKEVQKVIEINEQKGDNRIDKLEEKLNKIETIVMDLKFTLDILKGYGAIPPKMPNEEERKEIEKRLDRATESSFKKSKPAETQPQANDWIAIALLVILSIVLSVSMTIIITRATSLFS